MIDDLDYGARDSYPGAYNYNYSTSLYLDSSSSKQGSARAYTEETRSDKMSGCEPCKGFSSLYYDNCHAKEGNQCTGRTYPHCQRTNPKYAQITSTDPILYNSDGTVVKDNDVDDEVEYSDNFNKFTVHGGRKKEAFSVGDYEITDTRVVLIAIIFVCLIMLVNNNTKKKKLQPHRYVYSFIQDGYSPAPAPVLVQ